MYKFTRQSRIFANKMCVKKNFDSNKQQKHLIDIKKDLKSINNNIDFLGFIFSIGLGIYISKILF